MLQRKHMCRSRPQENKVFFFKMLLKMRLLNRCFRVNFAEFLRKSLLQNTSGRVQFRSSFSQVFLKIIVSEKLRKIPEELH